MARFLVVILLLFVLAVPASGKAKNDDIYPVPCSDLWAAVRDTLGNPGNYSIMTADDDALTASYVIVGAQRQRVNSVLLNPEDNGCALQLTSPDSGYMSDDATPFKKRVARSLAKMQAAKPTGPAKPAGGK
jgi:hypothetical protein